MPMPTAPTPDLPAVRRAVEDVADPELPAVTIGMLGMVADVILGGDDRIEVELLPTFSGCPATDMIARDVITAVGAVDGVGDVAVRFTFDPPWTPDRIDATGRERLRRFGITPPGGPVHRAVAPAGRTPLPLAIGPATSTTGLLAAAPPTSTTGPASTTPGAACPFCGSTDTTLDSPFGPTPCRDLRHCAACRQPFEAFKPA